MKRIVVAAVAAAALGFTTASRADAQIVYGYSSGYAPGGVVSNTTYGVPGLYTENFSTYYSPYSGLYRQMNYADVTGLNYARSSVYNPYLNLGYRTGYYQPGPYVNPFGLYSTYGRYYRRW